LNRVVLVSFLPSLDLRRHCGQNGSGEGIQRPRTSAWRLCSISLDAYEIKAEAKPEAIRQLRRSAPIFDAD
jgi:hypothetical protein